MSSDDEEPRCSHWTPKRRCGLRPRTSQVCPSFYRLSSSEYDSDLSSSDSVDDIVDDSSPSLELMSCSVELVRLTEQEIAEWHRPTPDSSLAVSEAEPEMEPTGSSPLGATTPESEQAALSDVKVESPQLENQSLEGESAHAESSVERIRK